MNAGTTVGTIEEAKALKWGVQTATTGQIYLEDVIQPDERSGFVPRHAVDVRCAHVRARSTP